MLQELNLYQLKQWYQILSYSYLHKLAGLYFKRPKLTTTLTLPYR